MARAIETGEQTTGADGERICRAYYEPAWKIDPREIGRCHLADFFDEELWMLEGLAALLDDIAMARDRPGEFPKEVRLSLKSIAGLEKSINRAVWSLREKVESLHAQMLHLGTVTYTGRHKTELADSATKKRAQ